MPHPFSRFWLVHYYLGDTPWLTISDLAEDEALKVNQSTGKSAGICPATGRERYYKLRLEVEEWDRVQHLARGGRTENTNPVYAVLSETEMPTQAIRVGNILSIPAESVLADLMSVCYGDSFPNFFLSRRGLSGSLLGRSYTPTEFSGLVSGGSLPTSWPKGYDGPEGFCVEVRLYTRPSPVAHRPSASVAASTLPAVGRPK